MIRKIATAIPACGLAVALILWFVSAPRPLNTVAAASHIPNWNSGERIFHAAGCASCHAAPDAKGEDKLKLTGGLEIHSPFGIFNVPNISPDTDAGIGGWSNLEFVNAVMRGVSPDGSHYYPAFPYTSYVRMQVEDILDLKVFMDTLPAVSSPRKDHLMPFPFNIRRAVGLWKWLFLSETPAIDPASLPESARRGQYLVEGPGHCAECHTPRNPIGGLNQSAWLSGAPNPDGPGNIPNITPHSDGIGAWGADDIASYFETGLSPDFEVVGGSMQKVQQNLAKLTADDRNAIAAYLKAVPALANGYPPKKPAGK